MSDVFPDRSMAFREKIEWMIETEGWAVVPGAAPASTSNRPSPATPTPSGSRRSFGFPEVVVFGLKPADARGLLGLVVALLRDGIDIPVGALFSGLLDNELRSALLPVALEEWGDAVRGGRRLVRRNRRSASCSWPSPTPTAGCRGSRASTSTAGSASR